MESPRRGPVLKPSRQPRSLASHRGRGPWAITACSPRPQLGRDRVKRFPSALPTGDADPEAEFCQLSPPPCGLGMVAGPSVAGPLTSMGEVGATPDSRDWGGRGGRRSQLWPCILLALQAAGGPEGAEPGAPTILPPYTKAIPQPGLREGNSLLLTVATTNSPWK